MAPSLCLPALRHALRRPLPPPRLVQQRRWAQVHDVRFVATHRAHEERVQAKYREKLESKARQQGLRDVSELREAYRDKIDELRKQAAVPGANAPLEQQPSSSSSSSSPASNPSSPGSVTSSNPSSSTSSSPWPSPPPPPQPQPDSQPATKDPNAPPPGVKTLSSFVDVEKIRTLPEKELTTLWRLRHANNPQSLHFALPASTFDSLLDAAKRHPSFVLPLPREVPVPPAEQQPQQQSAEDKNGGEQAPKTAQAAELHYLQFTHPHPHTTTLLFTTLAEFKLRGEFATPHTTVSFHSELAESNGLVLGQGVVVDGRGVSVDEARWLVMMMQKFYVGRQSVEGRGRGELLEWFSRGDARFGVERLLEEVERVV